MGFLRSIEVNIRPNDIDTARCVAACQQVINALNSNSAGRECASCNSVYANTHVPFKCVVCETQTINRCPSCNRDYSLGSYREMPQGIYTCPSCKAKLALELGKSRQWHLTKK